MFVQNVGQFADAARFYVPGAQGNSLWVTDDGLWLSFADTAPPQNEPIYTKAGDLHLKLTFPNANPAARPEPFDPLPTQVSYLRGGENRQPNVPVWRGIRYRNLYPGLDLELNSRQGQLTWQFIHRKTAATPTDPGDIRLRLDGADSLRVEGTYLIAVTSLGQIKLPLPTLARQPDPSGHHAIGPPRINALEVTAPFAPPHTPNSGPGSTSVQTSAYIAYSAFLGGSDDECVLNCVIAVDGGGSATIAGYTRSPDFPTTPGVLNRTHQGNTDLFVVKISLDGDRLDYATFIGGQRADFSSALAVDRNGNAYVAGYTASTDFPTTANALQPQYGGGFADAFVFKLNPNGTSFSFSTFLGGRNNDTAASLAVDRTGSVYLTGVTQSANFPISTDAFDRDLNNTSDAFVARLTPDGSRLHYAAFLGGNGREDSRAIAIDALGNAYVTGRTTSLDFPTTNTAFSTTRHGFADAYLVKVNPQGKRLVYASYLGGSSNDQTNGLTVDGRGQAYVIGSTISPDFPTTENAFDRTHDGGYDTFILKMAADGSQPVYSTLLGGSGGDRGYAIVVDDAGHAYATGFTYSTDFPTTSRAIDVIHDGDFADAFIVKLEPDGSGLSYATFLGGDSTDYGTAIAVDGQGSVYITGATQSAEFPAVGSTFGPSYGGRWDGFVTKLDIGSRERSTAFITGVIKDQQGEGIPGVVVSAGASGSTTTDPNGNYTLIGLREGIHTLTPLKEGYAFSPPRRTVSVPTSEGLQVFTAVAEGNPPAPFLDLPFDYGTSPARFLQALRDTDDGGWITSWFDHGYPDYAKNRNLILWDGNSRTKGLYNRSIGCYENRCYDDHNGIDITYRLFGENRQTRNGVEIRAAADGTVVASQNNCRNGNRRCGGGYGNQVIIYHPNGYFTQYGHLARVTVAGKAIKQGEPVGIMGSTGNSSGPHLHFGLYQDDGNGVWDGDEVDKPIDPYGWRGDEGDPWVLDREGPVSHYLWRYPLAQVKSFAGQQGAVLQDATGQIQVNVPPNALDGEVSMELFLGPVAGDPPGSRSVGRSFWLRLLQWLPTQTAQTQADISTVATALDEALTQPMTMTVGYTNAQISHLNINRMALSRWNGATRSWEKLPSQVNPAGRTVTAQSSALGNFKLHAPLICPADRVEPDDAYFASRGIDVDEESAQRLFDSPADEDWFYLVPEAGRTYLIETTQLGSGVDTLIEIYGVDARTRLAMNDNGGVGLASYLEWQAPGSGYYFIRVTQGGNSNHGCTARYALKVTVKAHQIYLPLILR